MDAERGLLGLDAENAARLAAAYEKAVSILSFNDTSRLPPASRAALLKAMLRHGRIYGFDESRLALTIGRTSSRSRPRPLREAPLSGERAGSHCRRGLPDRLEAPAQAGP